MADNKITYNTLKDSLARIKEVDSEVRERLWKLNFREYLEPVLKEWKYPYEIDAVRGNFTLTVAPGCYIHAKRHGSVYAVYIELNYANIQIHSSSSENQTLKDSPILVSLFGLRSYMFYFDMLAENIKSERELWEKIVKGEKGANLLGILTKPILRKNSLPSTTIEKCDDAGLFWLTKKIFKNVSLRTLISFDCYNDGCISLSGAYNCFPDCLCDCNRLYFRVGRPYMPNYANGIIYSGENTGESIDGHKILYSAPICRAHEDDLPSELSAVLDRLGYEYYKDGDTYYIYITEDWVIIRIDKLFRLKQISIDRTHDAIAMADGDFNCMMQLIAWGSPYESLSTYLGYVKNYYCEDLIIPGICKCLSDKITFYYAEDHFTFIDGDEYFTISTKQTGWLQTIYKLISVFNSHPDTGMATWRQMLTDKYSDVELVIKKKYDFWD